MRKTLSYSGCFIVLLVYVFVVFPLVLVMANASSWLANVGAIVVLVAGTGTAFWLMTLLGCKGKVEEKPDEQTEEDECSCSNCRRDRGERSRLG